MKKFLLTLCAVMLCVGTALAVETKINTNQVNYRIHLGMGVGTSALNPEKIRLFVDKEIATAFTSGFTVTLSRGQWAAPNGGVIRENTAVVDVQCDDTAENQAKIDAIAQSYVKQFAKAKTSCFVLRIPGVTTQLWY